MKTIYFVLPVLFILMLGLGIELKRKSFAEALKKPKPLLVGLTAQILLLPLITFVLIYYLKLSPVLAIGIMLIAACPGGTSSNVLSMLAGGDIALSVILTFASSFITLFTLPLIINLTFKTFYGSAAKISLSVPRTILQNFMLVILPIFCGYLLRKYAQNFARRLHNIIKKISMPALILMILFFSYNQKAKLFLHGSDLINITLIYIGLTIGIALLVSKLYSLKKTQERTIIIEVTIQNAALAISVAASPYLLNNIEFAVPAIVYAVIMNIIAFSYIIYLKKIPNYIFNRAN
jgi:BASS family bile acid:Na+ symporter